LSSLGWRQRNTLNQRQIFYYQHVLTVNDAAAEVRLFDLGRHFIGAYRRLRDQVRTERLDLARQQMFAQIGAGLVGLLSVAAALAWMAWQAVQGLFNLGDLAMFWQAMNQGQRLMRGLLTGVGEIYRNLLFAASVIEKLSDGYDTILGRWFGHAELSTGEWQRLALARAFVCEADLVILDEPTSAMDSWAEVAWMGRFRDLVAGRTALIITHRFTTAMQADVIHVMDQGRIIESGTHDELVALGGRYAQSWRLQMREVKATVPVNGDRPPPT